MRTQMNLLSAVLSTSIIFFLLGMAFISSINHTNNDAIPMLEVQLPTIIVKETAIIKNTDNEAITAYKTPKSVLDNFR